MSGMAKKWAISGEALIPQEETEQMWLSQWAALASNAHPELKCLYAIPNGGYRAKATAKAMKATGTKAGVPDVCLAVARGGYFGLYIEMKRIKGGKVSDSQNEWIERLKNQGYKAVVCKGFEAARVEIEKYLSEAPTQAAPEKEENE
mgnify:CR=1 FL=1